MRVNWRDYIENNPEILRGKPCIKGNRIPVSMILGYLAEGYKAEDILIEYPDLDSTQITACLDYARTLSEFELAY